jgi:urease accessory protein
MSKMNLAKSFVLLTGLLVSAVTFAHHPLGGAMPANFFEGILSGFGHPIIGLDHLAFIIAAGLLAWKLGSPIRLILSFIATTAIGSLVISSGIEISITETIVLFSVAIVGILLATKKMPSMLQMQTFYLLAGFFHGCAYGGAVIGAEPTPLIAYLAGFMIIQSCIALAAIKLVEFLSRQTEDSGIAFARLVGAAVFGIAVTYGFEFVEPILLN